MAHYAQIDRDNFVTRVIVITKDEIDTGNWGEPSSWIKTSYNTRGGVHYEPNSWTPSPDQSKSLRKNFAGIGYKYDPDLDAFYAPQPHSSWILDPQTCYWEAPVPVPQDGHIYVWDESTLSWVRSDGDTGVN